MAKSKIDSIVLCNYKKHEKLVIDNINGNHFILSGANGAGKTSVLESIKRLLGQEVDGADVPIRKGAKDATRSIYLSQNGYKYLVEERVTLGGRPRIRFYKVDGDKRDELTPALERLKEAVGIPIDFSPLIDKSGPEQLKFLKDELQVDVSDLEKDQKKIVDERKIVNREIKTLQTRIKDAGISKDMLEQYQEYKDVDQLLKQKINTEPIRQEIGLANLTNERIDQVEKEAADLQRQIQELQQRLEKKKQWLGSNPRVDVTELNQKLDAALDTNTSIDAEISTASLHNRQVDKVQSYKQQQEELKQKEQKVKEFKEKLEDIQGSIFEKLSSLNLGELCEGLEIRYTVDEEGDVQEAGLYYEGLPLHRTQHSYGTILKVIIKMSAHFNKGKLNFIPIGDWNLLDKNSQEEIWALAKENPDLGIQFGIEKVDDSVEVITEIIAQ